MKLIKRILKILSLAIGILAVLYLAAFIIRKTRVVQDQTILYTTHFKINYSGILKSEAEDISKSLEENYGRIRTELNDPEHDTITVFIHSTQKEFNTATGLINSKANGVSRGPKIFHLMYQTWYNSIFPAKMEKVAIHEFTHCVQLNILIADAKTKYGEITDIEFDKRFEKEFAEKYPQWFWEALCDYEANIVNKSSVNYAIKKGLTLKDLNKSNQIYNLGHTIVDYLVTTYGKEKLPDFIKSYGDFEKVLHVREQDFEKGWKKFVEEKY
jgi:hypothetical protein